MMRGGTYFSGGEGVGIAMRACGIEHVFGVEFDNDIADVARANGFESIPADVRAIDPAVLPYVDLFHASPVCKNASIAKADGKESPEDIATAEAVCRYIEHHKPRVFTLENVYGYRKFEAFRIFLQTLTARGYKWDYWHLNSADYGVPQTRQRLILVAARDFQPTKPRATHTDSPLAFFDTLKPWVGWYEAVEDLIPTLPLAYLKQGAPCPYDPEGTPCRKSPYCRGHFAQWQLDRLPKDVGGKLGNYSSEITTRDGDERFVTVTTSHNQKDLRALLVNESSTMEMRPAPAPVATQLANGRNGGQGQRAWLNSGRVVKMTPRALARFQSFPDSYILPPKTELACRVLGNAVPPKMYEAILRMVLEQTR